MKRAFFSVGALLALFIAITAFTTVDRNSRAEAPDYIKKDFVSSVDNDALQARFEKQFSEIFADVTHTDVHFNKEVGIFYYTVYGSNAAGEQVVESFKTTEEEVKAERYNYIEMTERTMQWPPQRKCREAITFPPPTTFCNPFNPGPICGIEVWPGSCLLY